MAHMQAMCAQWFCTPFDAWQMPLWSALLARLRGRAPLRLHPLHALHAVQVRYLKVIEKSGYQALPWVRYITTAGNYEIRMT